MKTLHVTDTILGQVLMNRPFLKRGILTHTTTLEGKGTSTLWSPLGNISGCNKEVAIILPGLYKEMAAI